MYSAMLAFPGCVTEVRCWQVCGESATQVLLFAIAL